MRETVSASADESERLGTLAPDAVAAIRGRGPVHPQATAVPGGAEVDPVTQIEVIEALAYTDESAGWCVMIGATSIGLPGAFTGDDAVAEIFKNGRIPTAAGSTALTGKAVQVALHHFLPGVSNSKLFYMFQVCHGLKSSDAGGSVVSDPFDDPEWVVK